MSMNRLIGILLLILLGLQYSLWIGEGSVSHVVRLKYDIDTQQQENTRLTERNRILALEVESLKRGLDSVEERAREDMGMIKPGETFYMVIDPDPNP